MIALLLRAGKIKILATTAILVALTALVDWLVGRNVSLALLYIVPMMLGAVVLRPGEIVFLAVLCSFLRACFDTPGSPAELALRFVFAVLAYIVSGLFVSGLVRTHELVRHHLIGVTIEQKRRREAEEQLKILAESSPAAILTVDGSGVVLAANAEVNQVETPSRGAHDVRWLNVAEDNRLFLNMQVVKHIAECDTDVQHFIDGQTAFFFVVDNFTCELNWHKYIRYIDSCQGENRYADKNK